MKAGFYTGGDHVLGMGHVFRCLALAKAIETRWPGASIHFHLMEGLDGTRQVQQVRPDNCQTLKPHELPQGPWDLLVVDRLEVPPLIVKQLRSTARVLVSLDDTGAGHYEACIAFNGLYHCKVHRPTGSRTKSFFGPEYLILNPAFCAQPYEVRPELCDLLLTQGGSDTYGLIPKLAARLKPWLRRQNQATLHIHIGPAFRFHAELDRILTQIPSACRHEKIPDMASFMAGMDLAISAAGMTAWELAAVGVPSILITGEAKELETSAELEKKGCCINLGEYSDADTSALEKSLDSLKHITRRQDMSRLARRAVDGKAIERILDQVSKKLISQS